MRAVDSAGILFICGDRCLLAHSTNSKWTGSWMPPKGHVEFGESIEQAAIREVEEEIGWQIKSVFLKDSFDVKYIDSKGKLYKLVRIFVVRIENEDPNKNGPMLKQVGTLQMEEVDRIQWFTKTEIKTKALSRYVEGITTAMK